MRHTSRRAAGIAATAAFALLCGAPALAGSTDYLLELGGVEGESSDDKHKNQIEILSYSWGATQTGSFGHGGGGGAGKVSMQDISAPSATSGASKDMTLKGSKIGENSAAPAGGVRVAVGDVDGDGRADVAAPRDAASGQATGKRMHKPVTFAMPLAKGSLTVRGKFPGCSVGARYPSLALGGLGKRYTLQDVVITSCGTASGGSLPMEEVSFNYAKIQF